MDGPADAVVVLNWRHEALPTEIRRINLHERPDLLTLLMKSRGRFYRGRTGSDPEPDAAAYLQVLADCPLYEVTGGVDFERAAAFCADLL
jgi:HprK-related kinase B